MPWSAASPICRLPLDKSALDRDRRRRIFLAWALMLSQAMESVTRVFYARADLDLILSSPVEARQDLLGAHRRDRAAGHRHGAAVVGAIHRRARDRRRRALARRLRRRHRDRPVGRGGGDRAHGRAVSPDRPEPHAARGADPRRGHRRRLRHRAAGRRDPVLRHAVALCGADLGCRRGLRARCREHRSGGRRAPRSATARRCCLLMAGGLVLLGVAMAMFSPRFADTVVRVAGQPPAGPSTARARPPFAAARGNRRCAARN